MRTATHVFLCMTISDKMMSMPARMMEPGEWRDYLRWSLLNEGFDMSRKIAKRACIGYDIYSQEVPACV